MAYGFSSPGDALNPLKNSMHSFEMVTYLFKGRNLGYSIITDKCASCTAPANVIDRIGRDNIPFQTFVVPANQKFKLKMDQPAAYRCLYK